LFNALPVENRQEFVVKTTLPQPSQKCRSRTKRAAAATKLQNLL